MTKRIVTTSQLSGNGVDNRSDKTRTQHLSFRTAQKMIRRFLSCDRIIAAEILDKKLTIQELAKKLSVNPLELEQFTIPISSSSYRKTSGKIALPLIKLYCNTKWAEDNE